MSSQLFLNYKRKIQEILGFDDYVTDIIENESNRFLKIPLTYKYPFLFYCLLAIITNILYPIIGLRRKIRTCGDDFIFISCPDPIFRTKNLGIVAGKLNYSIVYLPNFHIKAAIKYHRYFKKNGVKAFFPTFHITQVLEARNQMRILLHTINEGNEEFTKDSSILTNYLLYDKVAKNILSQVDSFKGKWVLEHQKFYFLPMVANLHKKSIPSTMLQHGVFFKPVYDFIPLLCDNVLCCSEREKNIYMDNGTEPNRIMVFGAPIQTLQKSDTKTTECNYDLLILMTKITEHNLQLSIEILNFVKNNYKSVLVRMRPRSRKNDENLLSHALKGMAISKSGTPISEDILCSKKVISFSVDANIEVSKYHKPFLFVEEEYQSNSIHKMNCVTSNNFKEEIRKLMNNDFYSTFNEEQYKEILGETDLNVLRERFVTFICS